ncbi:sigma-70 family RNA polymerase sigma factor [Candidatus Saganbacteria bacterium]|nr:sigma-70 family RNA polymerase sigma factor [Candidatus Saganbacteria bacterium]
MNIGSFHRPLFTRIREVKRIISQIEPDRIEQRNRTAVQNQGLVYKKANSYRNAYGGGLLDLAQEGQIGLLIGIEKFEASRGNKLSTYVTWWIRNRIVRSLKDNKAIRVPNHMLDQAKSLRRTEKELAAQMECDPTLEELAAASGLPIEKVAQIKGLPRVERSLDEVRKNEEGEGKKIEAIDPRLLEDFEGFELFHDMKVIEKILRQLVAEGKLTPRNLEIFLNLCMDDDLTLKEAGAQNNVCRERARQIKADTLRKIRQRLRSLDML